MTEKTDRCVKKVRRVGLLFIYRGEPGEEFRVLNQKWRNENKPVFGVNLNLQEKNSEQFEKYFRHWVIKYGVTSLSIYLKRAGCLTPGKYCPRLRKVENFYREKLKAA